MTLVIAQDFKKKQAEKNGQHSIEMVQGKEQDVHTSNQTAKTTLVIAQDFQKKK